MQGSSIVRFKRTLIDKLVEQGQHARYHSPAEAVDMLGEDGSGDAIWWADDDNTASYEITVSKGLPCWIDETASVRLRIQALARDTDADQETCDTRASSMLAMVIALLLDDPTLGITDGDIQTFHALPVSHDYFGGLHTPALRAARFELEIQINARLMLELP